MRTTNQIALFGQSRLDSEAVFKTKKALCECFFVLVETTGIEPVTPCMSSKYSNQLSYASIFATDDIISHSNGKCNPFLKIFLKNQKKGGVYKILT